MQHSHFHSLTLTHLSQIAINSMPCSTSTWLSPTTATCVTPLSTGLDLVVSIAVDFVTSREDDVLYSYDDTTAAPTLALNFPTVPSTIIASTATLVTLPEDGLPGSVTITFDIADGGSAEADPNAPHVLVLDDSFAAAGTHPLVINGPDLRASTGLAGLTANGVTNCAVPCHALVDGATYDVTLAYTDRFGNTDTAGLGVGSPVASHTLTDIFYDGLVPDVVELVTANANPTTETLSFTLTWNKVMPVCNAAFLTVSSGSVINCGGTTTEYAAKKPMRRWLGSCLFQGGGEGANRVFSGVGGRPPELR